MADYKNIDALILTWNNTGDGKYDDLAELFREAKAADIELVIHAHWIRYPDCGVTKCSNCGWSIEECWDSDYCSHCGAQMDEKDG